MTDSRILVERLGNVARLRFNDPSTRNALSMDMAIELRDRLREVEQSARVIVLAGSEKAFCSGANLGDGADGARPGEIDAGLGLEDYVNPVMMTLRESRVPLVTAVRGAAAGVGASFALMGDIIVAGQSAYFLQAFSRIGLVPDGGSPWLLMRTVGRVRAMELMMLGEKLGAQQAHDWGMVARVVPDSEGDDVALSFAQRLADGPTRALALTRKAAWAAAESTFEAELRLERWLQQEAGFHADFKEGVAAFLEKRPARFG